MIYVTNIQRFSLDDGPGIRTTVFLAGCNMRCIWCHNPETFEKVNLLYDDELCIKCGKCVVVCDRGVHLIENRKHIINRTKCKNCFKCVEVCAQKALKSNSKIYLESELEDIIMEDEDFYKMSDGGVTFSGGEPVLQSSELVNIFKFLHEKKVDIVIETALNYEFEMIEKLAEFISVFLIDIKVIDRKKHIDCTGMDNKKILQNIDALIKMQKRIWIRLPIIPNINMTLDDIRDVGAFFNHKQIEHIELLPYHKMGIYKYRLCGYKYKLNDSVEVPDREYMDKIFAELNKYDVSIMEGYMD